MSKPNRTLVGVLIFVSVAMNIFFVSWFVSHRPPMMGGRGKPPFERMMANVEQLQEPAKSEAKKIITSYRPQFEAQMKRMKASRAQLEKLFKSEDYSREKASAQFDAMQVEMNQMQVIGKEMILDVNEKLSPEDRVKMMPPMRGEGRGRNRGPDDGPPPAR